MKINRFAQVGAVAAIAGLALAGCSSNGGDSPSSNSSESSGSTLEGTLNATGASSQTAAQEAWVANFQMANEGVTINYEPTGSGTGRENFLAGKSNFIGSDRAFKDDEIAAGGFGACASDDIVELPLYISPIAIIFNVDGVDSLNLDADTVSKIFLGEITNWNDPAIAALNDGVELPDLVISPVHRSDESGTTENFTEYLSAVAPNTWTHEASGDWPITGGEAAPGTSGVVNAVRNGAGTIGYADASQAGSLGTVAIKVGDEFVSYSPEAAAKIVDASPMVEGRGAGDLAIDIDRTITEPGVYPIALVSYLIACQSYEDANVAELVSSYLTYVASPEGQDAAADNAGSAPISDDLRTKVTEAIALIG